MKLPPSDDTDTGAAAGPLAELSSAVRVGRLVGLLKGRGLTESTIEELLRPESALTLKAILTDHLFAERDLGDGKHRRNSEEDEPGDGLPDRPHQGGKLLVYRRR